MTIWERLNYLGGSLDTLMDGIEATRRIKEEMPGVRVVGLSMHEDEETAAKLRKAGSDAFITESASSAELIRAIRGSDEA